MKWCSSQKGHQGHIHTQELPLYIVFLLAQNRPSGNETTAGLRCKLSLHCAQFSRQFTFEIAEQWVCNWFQSSLDGDAIKERPSVSSPSAEASLDLSKCSAPTHASPYQTFSNWTTPLWKSRAAHDNKESQNLQASVFLPMKWDYYIFLMSLMWGLYEEMYNQTLRMLQVLSIY